MESSYISRGLRHISRENYSLKNGRLIALSATEDRGCILVVGKSCSIYYRSIITT